jgi:hypothetical protein
VLVAAAAVLLGLLDWVRRRGHEVGVCLAVVALVLLAETEMIAPANVVLFEVLAMPPGSSSPVDFWGRVYMWFGWAIPQKIVWVLTPGWSFTGDLLPVLVVLWAAFLLYSSRRKLQQTSKPRLRTAALVLTILLGAEVLFSAIMEWVVPLAVGRT